MLIGVNERHQIKQIRTITDESLTVMELNEDDELYLFKNWSDAKILSYCYKVEGNVVAIYPYINTDIIEKLETQEQKQNEITAGLAYELVMKELAIHTLEKTQADTLYQLMVKGVM